MIWQRLRAEDQWPQKYPWCIFALDEAVGRGQQES